MKEINYPSLEKAVSEAIATARNSDYSKNRSCCGRVYVCFVNKYRANSKLFKSLSKFFRVTKRPYGGSANYLYIGYDNATGLEMSVGYAVADALKSFGIECYADGDTD